MGKAQKAFDVPTFVTELVDIFCPLAYRDQAFVAGGFAACHFLAQDIDLWIPTINGNIVQERELIYTWLRGHCGFEGMEEQDTRDQRTIRDYGDIVEVNVLRVAKVPYQPLPVHVMMVDAEIDFVLKTFDVSAHQVGIDSMGFTHTGDGFTDVFRPVVKLRDTLTTDLRMEKITARYAHLREAACAQV